MHMLIIACMHVNFNRKLLLLCIHTRTHLHKHAHTHTHTYTHTHTWVHTHMCRVQQYLFSESSCQLLLSELKRLKVTKVLCVGTPRLHEAVLGQLAPEAQSLLLDVDCRYVGLLNSYSS